MRHSQKEASAVLHMQNEGLISVRQDEPRQANAPGQDAVFYCGDIM
jgi:tRNA U34 2-thiouridine synthase MnmA/TrmU